MALRAPAYRNAHGWAVRAPGLPAVPVAGGKAAARRRALALGGGVVYEAVGVGSSGTVLFAARERVCAPGCGCCSAPDPWGEGSIVAPDGLLLKGQGNPRNSIVFARVVADLTGALSRTDQTWAKPYLTRYIDTMTDLDWTTATGAAADKAWARARRVLRRANVQELIPTWVAHVRNTGERTMRGTKRAIRGEFLPRAGVSLSQRELTAMARIGQQGGWWVRNEMGIRSDRLTQRARGIVTRGIRDGLGRDQIASDLQNQIPDLWKRYGHNYARVTAAVAMARSRSYAALVSYQSAAIEWVEIIAVLDERTTEICFDGATQITMEDGTRRPISALIPGDVVQTGSGCPHPIRSVSERETIEVLSMILASGRQLMVTSNHPILTPDGWTPAGKLREGGEVAGKRTDEGRCVDADDVPQLRSGISGTNVLREARADAVLLRRMLSRVSAQGRRSRRFGQGLRTMWGGVRGAAFVRACGQGSSVLFQGVSAQPCAIDVSGVRGVILRTAVGVRQVSRPRVPMFDCLPGACTSTDRCRGDSDSRAQGPRAPVRKGARRRELLHRLRRTQSRPGDRGRRGLLARHGDGARARTRGVREAQGVSDCARWNGTPPAKRESFEARTDRRRAGELDPAEYLRRSVRDTIQSIEVVHGRRLVYNIEIDGDPTYIAEGVIVHNCRFMDGQIVPVGQSIELLDAGANVDTPEDIRQVNPFIEVRRDIETRQQYLQTANGVRLADIARSAVGIRDDRGEHVARFAGHQLPEAASIGVPPYHFGCRSIDVPRTDLIQVPGALPMRSVGIPAREPPAVIPIASRPLPSPGIVPTPRPAAGPPPAAGSPLPGRPTRALDLENRAWELGEPPLGDVESFSDWGWRPGVAPSRQIPPRVNQAREALVRALRRAAAESARVVGPQRTGEIIQGEIEDAAVGGVAKAVDRVRETRDASLRKAVHSRDRAAEWQRDQWMLPGGEMAVGGGVIQVPGRWYDPWCGRIGGTQTLTEPVEAALLAGDARTIADAWAVNPDHVAFVMAYLGGAWD